MTTGPAHGGMRRAASAGRSRILPGRSGAFVIGCFSLVATVVHAQAAPPDPSPATPVPAGPLTLAKAITRAIEANPQTLEAVEEINGPLALERAARGVFMPNLSGAVSQQRRTVNLAAQGLSFPGFKTLVGPYNVFDARVRLVETVFDWSRILALRSAGLATESARARSALAREQIASGVSRAYIDALSAQQHLNAARANRDLANELLKLSRDQRGAGIASGIDVARSQTAVARDDFALSQAGTALAQARLALQRLLVLPQGGPLELAEQGESRPQDRPDVDVALQTARAEREEAHIARQQITIAELDLRTARAAQLPNLSVGADYGISGNTPEQGREDTYSFGAQLNIPIYSGGVIEAQVANARSRLASARLDAQGVDLGIEQDVRLSVETLRNTLEQVRAARAGRDLAERELDLARDRFRQGAAGNLDVIQAQNEVANTRADYISALAAYDLARASFAAAIGRAQRFDL